MQLPATHGAAHPRRVHRNIASASHRCSDCCVAWIFCHIAHAAALRVGFGRSPGGQKSTLRISEFFLHALALLCGPLELRSWVSYIDHECARKKSIAVTPAMAEVLRVRDISSCCSLGDLGIILDAYRCGVSTHLADNAIGSSTDASRCSESYLPLRRDFRHYMTFGGCATMFRQLVDHSMRQGCALLRCDVFRGRLLMRARARRCSSAEVPGT